FFATLTIASDPATYGFRLGQPIDFDRSTVEVEGPLSLRYLASVAHVDEALLRDMNPALRQGIVPPGKVTVRVPPKSAEAVAARALGTDIETLIAMNNLRSPDALGEGDAVYLPVRARELGALLSHSDAYYAVKKGDTYYSIAKSHNLTVDELLALDELEVEHKL